jgi:uncharacterized membrane protein required for colicin V production
MLEDIVSQLNWVDVLIIVIFIRIIFIGIKKGFMVEFFKLGGILCAIFVSLHYYSKLSDLVTSHSPLPTNFADLICLVSVSVLVLILFRLFRDGILALIKIHVHNVLDRWGSLALSLIRGIFVTSLVILIIFLSTIEYFKKSVDSSFSKPYLLNISPRTYAFIFENIFSKFSSDEKLNLKIFKSLD